MTMRRSDRQIKDISDILDVLNSCQTIRLGLNGEDFPYVVPLSFGWEYADGTLKIYFHCAKEGKKLDLISRDRRACVEADMLSGYKRTEHGVTADYISVIAFGRAELVYGQEAEHGLQLLLEHCGVEGYSPKTCAQNPLVAVCRITVDEITGKRRFPPEK